MGRAFLVCRLAARDVRHHLAEAVLLVVAIAAATATLTMALALDGVTSQPYQQTRNATRGPDLVVYITSPSQAAALIHARGVVASSGPFPVASATIEADGRTGGLFAEGRSEAPAAVDQPDVTAGSWVRPGGVVLERTFAQALDVGVGAGVTISGRRFTVVGIAVTAAQAPYPNLCYLTTNTCGNLQTDGFGSEQLGVAWTTEADARALASATVPLDDFALNLKLQDPADAPAFAAEHTPAPGPIISSPADQPELVISTWEGIAAADALLVQDAQSVLIPGSLLLALLAVASVAVLVGRRLSEYARRVGLLKAVGGTPALVAATFLVENVALAVSAAVVGLAAGRLIAPLLTDPGAALIGAPAAPSLSALKAAEVLGVALVVALAATLVPAIRAARASTVRSLAEIGRQPRRGAVLIRLSRRLPVPMLFGLRLVARRPRRALLSTANMAVTVTGLVVVVAFHTSVAKRLSTAGLGPTAGGLSDPVINRDLQMLGVLTVMLVTLALLNAVFTTWAMVADAQRASAVLRALGARARQVSLGLVVAQVVAALPGTLAGVGLGILAFRAAVSDGGTPSVLWLVLTVLGSLAAVAALTAVPARLGARRSIADALASEAA
ncbi:MAG TPA: FtsX-like permease family protein [Actinocrinis sp.]|jgi:putative ABC transport system permease protein